MKLNLHEAIVIAKYNASQFVISNPIDGFRYPCGFATLEYKTRKNNKEAKILIEHGFRWNDYNKRFYITAYEWTDTQSMEYKEDILTVMLNSLKDCGFINFMVATRMD